LMCVVARDLSDAAIQHSQTQPPNVLIASEPHLSLPDFGEGGRAQAEGVRAAGWVAASAALRKAPPDALSRATLPELGQGLDPSQAARRARRKSG
jgi:hypothetical protein